MEPICPNPSTWYEIYVRLSKATMLKETLIEPPPRPLILANWDYSNDSERKNRWEETLEWASRHGMLGLIGDIPEEAMYKADLELSTLRLMSGDPYANRHFKPQPVLSAQMKIEVMERLRDRWKGVAGPIAEFTRPLRFSGRKGRRLVVFAAAEFSPPWGSWSKIAVLSARHFTEFRRSVNRAIEPHEVDHIDFVHDEKVE